MSLPASVGAELRVGPNRREGALTKATESWHWWPSQSAQPGALITAPAHPSNDIDVGPCFQAPGAGKHVHALRLILLPRENQYYL
jgi:hypothetical protein